MRSVQQPLVCRDCSGPIDRVGARGRIPTQCAACRRRHGPPRDVRTCRQCSTAFTPERRVGRFFCSESCRTSWWAAETARRYRDRAKAVELTCVGCGVAFSAAAVTPRPTRPGSGSRRFCSRGCGRRYAFRQRYGSGNYLQRPATTRKQRLVVFERDRWRCGICQAPIDRDLRWPHPGSATLDHILPLADGGDHVPTNWQAAHAACNIEKGNLRRKRVAA